jgi:hypothetical protein
MSPLNRVPEDEDEAKVLDDVRTYGWHVVLIEEDQEGPGFGFTVGLFQCYGHAEIVVFGLPLELTHAVLNGIGEDVKGGASFAAAQEYDEILEGYRCVFLTVDRTWYHEFLGYARWFYRGNEFPALQCVWPDKAQNYPWDPEFNAAWKGKQPLLTSGGRAPLLGNE